MARLTILLPAYHASPFIHDAIDSLLHQSFTDFELWIIDDGSLDNTREIISNFTDNRIKKFYHDVNRGKTIVVNELINKVTSEFLTVTDADDISHPHRLKLQIERLDADEELMMCGTSYTAVNEEGYVIRSLKLKSDYKEIYASILERSQFLGATVVMRTNAVNHLSEFYRPYFSDCMEDSDLDARMVDKFKSINLPQSLYYYRILKTSLSHKNYTIRFSHLYKVISFLTEERRRSGTDSLMNNKSEVVDQYMELMAEENRKDPSLIYRRAAFYFMYWKLTSTSWGSARKAFMMNPLRLKNFLLVIYIAMLGVFEILRRKKHY